MKITTVLVQRSSGDWMEQTCPDNCREEDGSIKEYIVGVLTESWLRTGYRVELVPHSGQGAYLVNLLNEAMAK